MKAKRRSRWEEQEDQMLREKWGTPIPLEQISSEIGRPIPALWFRAHRLHLRRRGDRGNVMTHGRCQDPPAPRVDLAASMTCPGNGKGCGKRLFEEMVPSGYGYIAPGAVDLVCLAGHRFKIK